MKLTREELIEATTEGVRRAFRDVLTDDGLLLLLTGKDICDAIKDGANRALWDVATSNEMNPAKTFYDAIREGVREAMEDAKA